MLRGGAGGQDRSSGGAPPHSQCAREPVRSDQGTGRRAGLGLGRPLLDGQAHSTCYPRVAPPSEGSTAPVLQMTKLSPQRLKACPSDQDQTAGGELEDTHPSDLQVPSLPAGTSPGACPLQGCPWAPGQVGLARPAEGRSPPRPRCVQCSEPSTDAAGALAEGLRGSSSLLCLLQNPPSINPYLPSRPYLCLGAERPDTPRRMIDF